MPPMAEDFSLLSPQRSGDGEEAQTVCSRSNGVIARRCERDRCRRQIWEQFLYINYPRAKNSWRSE